MNTWEVVVLAFVQGLTEFLPVSSSGHLVLARWLLGIGDAQGSVLDGFLHLGTLAALLLYFWRTWTWLVIGVIKGGEEGQPQRKLAFTLVVATIPAAMAGYFFAGFMDGYFRGLTVTAWSFLFTAAVLVLGDFLARRKLSRDEVSWRDALFIGVSQVLALLPAVSRSGVTIAAGMMRGLTRERAVTFSFLMSAPIIAGAGFFSLMSLVRDHILSGTHLWLGFLVACASGLVALHGTLWLVKRLSFTPFVAYLVLLSLVLLYAG